MKVIGVVSDTHGLIRPQALAELRGCDLILHAGDIGAPEVIEALQPLAPVVAVRGNVDREAWAERFPATQYVELEGCRLYVLHDLLTLDLDPVAAGIDVVVYGHSHQPAMATKNGVLYLNPGSAGPRRFRLPVSLAQLRIGAGNPQVEFVELQV